MFAVGIIIGATFVRLLPHIPNFTPLTAIGLFGGRYLPKRYAILIPLLSLIISDYLLLYINPFAQRVDFSRIYPLTSLFHSTTLFVWGSFLISSLIGITIKNRKSFGSVLGATFLASLQFFLITNFGVWATGAYARGIDGLIQSYIMGLPFFQGTLLGDIFYTFLLFGAYECILWGNRKHLLIYPQKP